MFVFHCNGSKSILGGGSGREACRRLPVFPQEICILGLKRCVKTFSLRCAVMCADEADHLGKRPKNELKAT